MGGGSLVGGCLAAGLLDQLRLPRLPRGRSARAPRSSRAAGNATVSSSATSGVLGDGDPRHLRRRALTRGGFPPDPLPGSQRARGGALQGALTAVTRSTSKTPSTLRTVCRTAPRCAGSASSKVNRLTAHAVAAGLHRRRQDVDPLVGQRLGDVGEQAVPVERLDLDGDEEHRAGVRRPTPPRPAARACAAGRRRWCSRSGARSPRRRG